MRRRRESLFFCALLALSLGIGPFGCSSDRSQSEIKLVVVIVVDQFRYDYVERFSDSFGAGGFKRLMSEGAFFANADYNYAPTYTAPGHASIFTGSTPSQNGIVGNLWYDRAAGAQKVIVSDDSAKVVTSYGIQSYTKTTRPASPRILIGTTFGDQMRLATGFRSKVIAVSLKDRAAVLPGGREANGAYWFDASSGSLVSSDYYFRAMPEWVDKFNAQRKPDSYFARVWEHALPASAYETTQGVTTDVKGSPLGRNFPFSITGGEEKPGEEFYKAFQYTPFASEYLADFAKAAIDAESLGADKYPDLLAISFSTPDLVGHSYGPDSDEVEDIYIRLDQVIADFLNYVDDKVGLSNTIIAVTGDHGVAPIPRLAVLNKIDAEVIDPAACIDAVNKALQARFGGEKWVENLVNDQIYLNRAAIEQAKADPAEAERLAGKALLGVRGIASVFTRTQIINGQMPPGLISKRISNGFNPNRSGDVWFITNPFCFVGEGELATTHGSPYDYDCHVPIFLLGPGIRADRYYQDCAPADIAPTICALLRVEAPSNVSGRVLTEALSKK